MMGPAQWRVDYYRTEEGRYPFREWMERLKDFKGKATIEARLTRLRRFGHAGQFEPVGDGVFELKVDHGPGYRVYFAKEDEHLALLLCGGDKKRQNADIAQAKDYWSEHQARTKKERRKNAKKGKS